MKISIAIPTWEYRGLGVSCLQQSFSKMAIQDFKDFEVVISDHSIDNGIKDLCYKWSNQLDIKYFRNMEKRGNPAANTNKAIFSSCGEWIKVLCQDDYLAAENSLSLIVEGLDDVHDWQVSGYIHTQDGEHYYNYHYPVYNDMICVINTIGTPSCLTIKNIHPLPMMDENLSYAYDCEYYHRLKQEFGLPKILPAITIVNRVWNHSITSGISQDLIKRENDYILRKHGFMYENSVA